MILTNDNKGGILNRLEWIVSTVLLLFSFIAAYFNWTATKGTTLQIQSFKLLRGKSHINVYFSTNQPARGELLLLQQKNQRQLSGGGKLRLFHSFTVDGLAAGDKVEFRLLLSLPNGQVLKTGLMSVTTAKKPTSKKKEPVFIDLKQLRLFQVKVEQGRRPVSTISGNQSSTKHLLYWLDNAKLITSLKRPTIFASASEVKKEELPLLRFLLQLKLTQLPPAERWQWLTTELGQLSQKEAQGMVALLFGTAGAKEKLLPLVPMVKTARARESLLNLAIDFEEKSAETTEILRSLCGDPSFWVSNRARLIVRAIDGNQSQQKSLSEEMKKKCPWHFTKTALDDLGAAILAGDKSKAANLFLQTLGSYAQLKKYEVTILQWLAHRVDLAQLQDKDELTKLSLNKWNKKAIGVLLFSMAVQRTSTEMLEKCPWDKPKTDELWLLGMTAKPGPMSLLNKWSQNSSLTALEHLDLLLTRMKLGDSTAVTKVLSLLNKEPKMMVHLSGRLDLAAKDPYFAPFLRSKEAKKLTPYLSPAGEVGGQ